VRGDLMMPPSSTSGLQKDGELVIDGIACEEITYAEV